jgi:hypothetical protein
MHILKTHRNEQGAIANVWRITEFVLNPDNRMFKLQVSGFADGAFSEAKIYLDNMIVPIDDGAFDQLLAILDAPNDSAVDLMFTVGYNYLVTYHPILQGGIVTGAVPLKPE